MRMKYPWSVALILFASLLPVAPASAQIGRRFPSERKIVVDPVTGVPLTFLTSTPGTGDAKIYQTHHQWTSDGQWVIFRSNRPGSGQAMAVNVETGDIVQVSESGFMGMLCVADHSMHLYFLRPVRKPGAEADPVPPPPPAVADVPPPPPPPPGAAARGGWGFRSRGPVLVIGVDLAKLLTDSAAGALKAATEYERVCGTIPADVGAADMALDASEDYAFVRTGRDYALKHISPDTKLEPSHGPRGMGAGPSGLISVNLHTGEIKDVVSVPFQVGHVQTNPWVPGEIVFCWETGGKAPQRTWTVRSDGSGLRPLYPEAPYEWITHEAVISRDEVAIAILSYSGEGVWGTAGTDEHPSGVGIVNLRTRKMRIVGQVPLGDPGRSDWHVNGSPDGRWAVCDDFRYRLWLIDRHSGQMAIIADLGQKTGAQDHVHPTFNADSTKIEIQTAMLSADGRSLNICVVPVPKSWLARTYSTRIEP